MMLISRHTQRSSKDLTADAPAKDITCPHPGSGHVWIDQFGVDGSAYRVELSPQELLDAVFALPTSLIVERLAAVHKVGGQTYFTDSLRAVLGLPVG